MTSVARVTTTARTSEFVVTEAFGLTPVDVQDDWVERREIRLRELEVRRAGQVRGSLNA